MSVAVGTVSTSETTFSQSSNMKEEDQKSINVENLVYELKETGKKHGDHNEEDNTQVKGDEHAFLNPNKQVENEKGDEGLTKCKQQILGSIDTSAVEENIKGPEVQILSLTVLSPGRTDFVLAVPFSATTSKATLFTLKEGSKYRIKFHFTVSKNVVTGLTYTYMVWKAGIRVHQTKKLMGTFIPRQEPYTFELEEGTTPTGFFARGPFLVRSKFVDEDGNCYLDTTYYFDIRKDWGARDKC